MSIPSIQRRAGAGFRSGAWACVLFLFSCMAAAQAAWPPVSAWEIVQAGPAPQGLVGNGRSLVIVRPGQHSFHWGGDASGQAQLIVDGVPLAPDAGRTEAVFVPGAVIHRQLAAGLRIQWLHGALPDRPYVLAVQVQAEPSTRHRIEVEVADRGTPALAPAGRRALALDAQGRAEAVWAAGGAPGAEGFDALLARMQAPYRQGLALQTPDASLNRAVAFNRYLLDLGFDGKLHVCELFRWRDVWSRDLGSGLAPGALASGRFADARATIDYDLARYASHRPTGLRVTEDPSQGGSAEGTAWLTRAVWRDYLQSGDRAFLQRAAAVLRPWVQAWADRDADERGLLIDTTEWMDHSRFFLFPDGARILYSNALMADLLRSFAAIETALGQPEAAARWSRVRERFIAGINAALWDDGLGAYANLSLWGQRDLRLSSDGNVLAVLAGVASPERAGRALATLRERGWRAAGSVTITPPMSHVDAANDHNYKVWPWWNAVEARARFRHGDVAGALHLLERSAATLEDAHDPGLIEELVSTEGLTEGGHAFLTAAGSYLDAVWEGLLGIDVLETGAARLRVSPNVPAAWADWQADVPLAQGGLQLRARAGRLSLTVSDPRVREVEVPEGVEVHGARAVAIKPIAPAAADRLAAPQPLVPPAPRPRQAAVFQEPGLSGGVLAGLPAARVDAEQLLTLDPARTPALIVAGNALPLSTRSGGDVRAALARYLERGGALVFFGATMQDRGGMGEHGGVVDWYRPAEAGAWQAMNPFTGQPSERPVRHAVVSWGPGGDFFNGWETALGAFGFRVDGHGAEFAGPLAALPPARTAVQEAFTDFAVRKPWLFQPLAYTQTERRLLHPALTERYPCAARLVNTATGGEIILLPASLTRGAAGLALLERLGLR